MDSSNSFHHTPRQRFLADAALLAVAFVWGTTFTVVKEATAELPTFSYLAIRFALAAVVLILLYPRRFSWRSQAFSGRAWKDGAIIGLFLFLGYGFQTLGLQTTTPSKAGFLTGLAVVLVPLLSAVFLRERLAVPALAGVTLATAGLGLLTLNGAAGSATGDLLVLGCALAFALHIIAVGRFSAHHDPVVLAFVQIAVTSAASGVAAWLTEPPVRAISPRAWGAIVLTGVLATSAAFLIQTTAQRFTTSTHTALIFTMEPVFAATFSYLYLGEVLTPRAAFGGLLVLAGMVVAQRRVGEKEPLRDRGVPGAVD